MPRASQRGGLGASTGLGEGASGSGGGGTGAGGGGLGLGAPRGGGGARDGGGGRARGADPLDGLTDLIETTLAPESWSEVGGPGTIHAW